MHGGSTFQAGDGLRGTPATVRPRHSIEWYSARPRAPPRTCPLRSIPGHWPQNVSLGRKTSARGAALCCPTPQRGAGLIPAGTGSGAPAPGSGCTDPFPTGGGGVLVRTDDGGGNLYQPVDDSRSVGLSLDLLEDPREHSIQGIPAEARVDGLPRTVPFRQITPRDPGTNLVDHATHDPAVIRPWSLVHGPRYQRSQQVPFWSVSS